MQPKKPIGLKKQKAVSDNTSVKGVQTKDFGPKYTYLNKIVKSNSASKKDSSDYRRGYVTGINTVSKNKSGMFGDYKKGIQVVGLNDRFNEGFSEGKDKALDKKKKK